MRVVAEGANDVEQAAEERVAGRARRRRFQSSGGAAGNRLPRLHGSMQGGNGKRQQWQCVSNKQHPEHHAHHVVCFGQCVMQIQLARTPRYI